jgi:threonine aldolase
MSRLQQQEPPILLFRERIVIHHQISPQAVEDFIHTVREMKEEREASGLIVNKLEEGKLKEDFKSEGKLRRKVALGY